MPMGLPMLPLAEGATPTSCPLLGKSRGLPFKQLTMDKTIIVSAEIVKNWLFILCLILIIGYLANVVK
jgi:hypothetical protein